MVPDSNRGHIGFFVDNGGHQFAGSIGAKDGEMKFSFNLKFLAWLNLAGANVPESDINHIILPHVIEAVALKNIAVSEEHFENGFRNFKVDNVGVLASNASMFQPFHFFEAGAKAGLFNYPYGYFGLQLVGTFSIARKCLNPSILPKYVAACTPQI
jgi:hypothetical protein